jgi:hypothetical protein
LQAEGGEVSRKHLAPGEYTGGDVLDFYRIAYRKHWNANAVLAKLCDGRQQRS